jgi:uncharacterized protein (TIGR03083 family)
MTDLQKAIAGERRELAAVLAGLPARSWDTPTLCAGWRVREVVAHTTMPFRYAGPRFALELLRSVGNFARMADRCARRDAAAMSADELTRAVADNAEFPWQPPGGGFAAALTHEVVHGLDWAVPLGIERRVPADRLGVVLGQLIAPRALKHFGSDLRGVELIADDLDWRFGSGTPLSATAQDLALVLAGRRLPAGRLSGRPAAQFSG